ncbi:acyl-CoA synthetase [Robbsia sp. Bb-Pol-6]|uniref:Acyl-CoA synthetase n=1 Tax=Robbsia betulipollinis TaxID=2981849 RepID=A0ABT3ZSX3_9BURK|nr:acyl-CoA synthetase [Robbsia betulipollinis]MCY0388983.1 acyl-CoA synthetase [Robbsia betulipollinis]
MLTTVMNLGDLLTQVARRHPNEPGFITPAGAHTWSEINRRVDTLCAALRAFGVEKGDRILVHSRNNLPLFESAYVAFKLGAVWVPTNYRVAPPEAAYLAKSSKARVMIYDRDFGPYVDAARAASPALMHVVAIGEPRENELSYEAMAIGGTAQTPFPAAEVDRDDPLWFFYTSGTTGSPKAGTLTHGQMAFVINNHLADLLPGISHRSRSLVVAPLSHGAGIHAIVNTARGAASVLPGSERLDPEEVWSLVQTHRVDNMFTVPTIVKMLTEHESVDRYDHSSLRFVVYAGAPMYRADQKHALSKLGRVLVQYYGLGEVTGNITVLPPALHEEEDDAPDCRAGTCGYARTGIEIAIFADDGRRLAPLETGEICVRGPAVFVGYDDNPEANEKAFKFGWFHTGDLGHLDDQGYLFITGRSSDMYISGGSNVYPREVEEALLMHDSVHEVAVLGMPDPKWGESGIAVVVCKGGHRPSPEQLLGHLEGRLARYKWPREFVFWDALPRSAYGKITKNDVRAQLAARASEPVSV